MSERVTYSSIDAPSGLSGLLAIARPPRARLEARERNYDGEGGDGICPRSFRWSLDEIFCESKAIKSD